MFVNVIVRDIHLAFPNAHDARRLGVFVDGLPLYGGAQLARHHSGVSHSGRWDCQTLCRVHRWHHLGPGPAQNACAKQMWKVRWAAPGVALVPRLPPLFSLRVGGGADGDVPRSHDVANDFRHVCLG